MEKNSQISNIYQIGQKPLENRQLNGPLPFDTCGAHLSTIKPFRLAEISSPHQSEHMHPLDGSLCQKKKKKHAHMISSGVEFQHPVDSWRWKWLGSNKCGKRVGKGNRHRHFTNITRQKKKRWK